MIKPTVHLNGTSKEELVSAYVSALEALRLAHSKVALACPNERDYYVKIDGDEAFREARTEQRVRLSLIERVISELQEIAESL